MAHPPDNVANRPSSPWQAAYVARTLSLHSQGWALLLLTTWFLYITVRRSPYHRQVAAKARLLPLAVWLPIWAASGCAATHCIAAYLGLLSLLSTRSTYLNVGEAALYSICWWASGLALIGIYYPKVDGEGREFIGPGCLPWLAGVLHRCVLQALQLNLLSIVTRVPPLNASHPAVLVRADNRLSGGRPAHGPGLWLLDLLAPAPHVARGHAV